MLKKAGLVAYVKRLNTGRLAVMTSLLLLCTTLEYYLHIVIGISGAYPHLFYVPLFIGSFWWGFGGGLSIGIFLGVMHATSYLPQISQIVLAESLAFALVGSATGVIGSERIRAQKKLKEAYEKEARLRQDLQAEMERRVEFTRALVHELKTPLTPMLSSSELLVEELREEPYSSLAKNINRGAMHLNERIDELLDLARGELGMLKLKIKQVEPLPLLQNIAEDMASLVANHKQSLHLELPSSLPPVRADENRLRQVVLNLLSNASKFTPEGGSITLRARAEQSRLTIEVENTGSSISQEDQQLIFEPYYSARTGRIQTDGLGIGLPLCRTLVKLHRGSIWVESHDNRTTFGFTVPLQSTLITESPLLQAGETT